MKRLVLVEKEREEKEREGETVIRSCRCRARILRIISNPEKIGIERWSWQTILPSLLLFSWTSARVIPSPRKKIKSSVRSGTIDADFPFQFSETRERVGGGVCPPPSPPNPCTFRGGTGGKSCWRIDSRATSTSSIGTRDGHRTWKGSSGETERRHAAMLSLLCPRERWQPSCGAFYSRSTCRIVFEVAWTYETRGARQNAIGT